MAAIPSVPGRSDSRKSYYLSVFGEKIGYGCKVAGEYCYSKGYFRPSPKGPEAGIQKEKDIQGANNPFTRPIAKAEGEA